MEWFALLVSFLATTAGAISGIGGGVIIKPVLDAAAGLPVATVSFLSGCTVLAMSVVSLARSTGARVEKSTSTPLALGAALGGLLGKGIFERIRSLLPQGGAVGAVQSALLLLMLAGVFLYVRGKGKIRTRNLRSLPVMAAVGLLLGLVSAFLGIGGGPMNIALLSYCFSMDAKTSAVNSIYIILFSQAASLLSTFLQGHVPEFSPPMLLLMILGGVGGGLLGSRLSGRMTNRQVDRFFSLMLLFLAAVTASNLLRFINLL